MIRVSKNIFLFLCVFASVNAFSQSTTNSPYSEDGLGLLSGPQLPQNRAMGGIAAGLRRSGGYNNINLANPASYSAIQLTTFDVGMYGGINGITDGNATEKNFTASLNHLVFAIPVNKKSAVSFGILPFSTMGYRYRTPTVIDGINIDHIYSGDGGLSKAYAGYGFQLGKHLSLGANVSYVFGKLEKNRDTESPDDLTFTNSRNQSSKSIGGLSFDYGAQYFQNLSKKVKLTLGYSGTAGSKLDASVTELSTHYTKDATGAEDVALDTTFFNDGISSSLKLPLMHRLGFVIEKADKWLVGADLTLSQWEKYREGSVNPGLNNSMGIAVGGQITPDITSVGSYLKLVEYRLGFKYDKTYLNIENNDIKEYALTFGFGFPLPSNRSTFYKINLGTELGRRGATKNNLVRENFANIYLGFTINDKWFQRYKFD